MDSVIESLPEELQSLFKKDVIVTGGCIASMLMGEEVNDYDVYFKRYKTAVLFAKHYLAEFLKNRTAEQGGIPYTMSIEEMIDTLGRQRVRVVIKSAGVASTEQKQDYEYFEGSTEGSADTYVEEAMGEVSPEAQEEKPSYAPVFLSSNAITLKGDVQIILRFYGDAEAIHENFDFVHCMNYWDYAGGLVLNQDSLEAILSRTLVYRGSLYPVCSVFRTKKFIQRGWKINAGQQLKMCLQIAALDLTNFQVLEEQLTGVDVAYFTEVLAKAQDKENPMVLETAYLVEIIDRMF
jgi:hypothetical protein